MKNKKEVTSIRLDDEDRELIYGLQREEDRGSMGATIRRIVREVAKGKPEQE